MTTIKCILLSALLLPGLQALARDHDEGFGHDQGGAEEGGGHKRHRENEAVVAPAQAPAPHQKKRARQPHPAGNNRPVGDTRNHAPRPIQAQPQAQGQVSVQAVHAQHAQAARPSKRLWLKSDRQHSQIIFPHAGADGQAIHSSLVVRAQIGAPEIHAHFRALAGDSVMMGNLRGYNRSEIQANHYYWHSYHGMNYCHYYDPWHYHWYGWYMGDRYFWTRFDRGFWWWYDPLQLRWCYWDNNNWWWSDPLQPQAVYLYHDGDYMRSDYAGDSPDAGPENPDDSVVPSMPQN